MNKKTLYGLVALIAVGLVVWAIVANQDDGSTSYNTQPLRDEMEVIMTSEQRVAIEKTISNRLGQIEATKTQQVPQDEVHRLYVDLAFNYYSLGKLKLAKEAYLKAVEINPNNPATWMALFPVYRDMYDLDNARNAIRKVVALAPEDWNAWRSYIEFEQYHVKASNEELDKLYREALEKTSNDMNIITVYAKFLEKIGNLEGSLKYWKLALEKQPDSQQFKAEVERLEALLNK